MSETEKREAAELPEEKPKPLEKEYFDSRGEKKACAKSDEDWDDGRTVADMDADWMPWNAKKWWNVGSGKRNRKKTERVTLTKQERRAAIWGAMKAAMPFFGTIILIGLALFAISYLWLM